MLRLHLEDKIERYKYKLGQESDSFNELESIISEKFDLSLNENCYIMINDMVIGGYKELESIISLQNKKLIDVIVKVKCLKTPKFDFNCTFIVRTQYRKVNMEMKKALIIVVKVVIMNIVLY